MTNPELRKLLETAQKGDEKSFDIFFKWCYQTYKHRMSTSEYEDVFMSAMFKFWEKYIKEGTVLPSNIKGYFYRMAENRWINEKNKVVNKITDHLDLEKVEYLLNNQRENDEFDVLVKKELEGYIAVDQQNRLIALNTTFQQLSGTCQKLLIEKWLYGTKLRGLMEPLGFTTYNSIKTKASQCFKRLINLATKSYNDHQSPLTSDSPNNI